MGEDGDEGDESIRMVPQVTRLSAVEDFSASESSSLGCALPAWRSFRHSISNSFLRSLCVVSSLKMDKFPLVTLHSRKVSYTGMYNLVHVFSNIRSLTCWEPLF